MGVRGKNILIHGSLVVGSIVFALLVLEIVARIFFSGALNNQTYREYDAKVGYRFKPHISVMVDTGNGPHSLVTNAYGYVGSTLPKEKPAGEFRIAHFGDSFVEGVQMVDWDQNFVALIERDLNAGESSQQFRSMNFGVSGRGTVESLWAYEQIARDLDPDLAILWFTLNNDFANNYLPIQDISQAGNNATGGIKKVLKRSALVNLLFERLKDNLVFIKMVHRLRLSNKVVDTEGIVADDAPFDLKVNYSIAPEMVPVQEKSYAITRELVREFAVAANADAIPFIVILIPDIIGTNEGVQREFFDAFPKVNPDDFDFAKARREITTILRDEEIPFFDLSDPLDQYAQGKSAIDPCGELWDDHFTACGHRVVAELVSKFIRNQYFNENI